MTQVLTDPPPAEVWQGDHDRIIVDLFEGAGGWAEGARMVSIDLARRMVGVEIMAEAIATAPAARRSPSLLNLLIRSLSQDSAVIRGRRTRSLGLTLAARGNHRPLRLTRCFIVLSEALKSLPPRSTAAGRR